MLGRKTFLKITIKNVIISQLPYLPILFGRQLNIAFMAAAITLLQLNK